MRIAYIAEIIPSIFRGVLNKIVSQVEAWISLGHEARIFLVTSERFTLNSGPKIEMFTFRLASFFPRRTQVYMNKILSASSLKKALIEYQPDIIYYRQGMWYPGLEKVLSVAPFVIEINTYDEGELKGVRKFFNRLTRNRIYRKAKALIVVTEELSNILECISKPIFVATNGYDTSKVIPRPVPHNERPQLIFVGTPGMPWHGVDKIIVMASLLPEFEFHLVGPELGGSIPNNIKVHKFLDHEKLLALYQKIDVGVGTLALHRKSMNQASPLKVREYLAFGLPVIIAYDDPDLRGCDFVLQIPNEEDNVKKSLNKIKEFVLSWKGKSIPMDEVIRRIDLKQKEAEKIAFLENFCKSR
ncbi:MAG: glycosyltransferase [Thermosediminibacteraceae bacterium]|nr:glycosyltransferase [Thermosediminibacteraceae bacterium]